MLADGSKYSISKQEDRLARFVGRSYLAKWVLVGLLIGLVAGFGATIFYFMIELVSNNLLGTLTGFYPPNPAGEPAALSSIANPRFILIPVSTIVGGLISGLIVYRFAPEAEGHGTDAAIDAFHNKSGVIRRRIPLVKTIASAFTIGSGGSAGREGPTAQIAAGFGSLIGEIFKLSAKDRRIAVAAGIGAGIGAIFKSPFGGAILSAEILYSGPDMEAEALIPAFVASPIGYVIFASFTGFEPLFGYTTNYTFNHPLNLVIYAFLGVLCAAAGRLYTFTFYSVTGLFKRLKITNYAKPVIGGAMVGVIAIFFPQILALGYGFLQLLIDGNLSAIKPNGFSLPGNPALSLILVLILVLFAKIFATSITVGSGGSGGVFAPSLMIGGFVGAALYQVVNAIVPGMISSPAPLVVIGMMALFAGVGRAPIAVILMVSEMTGTIALIAPSMVAVVVSYYLTGPGHTIYRSQVFSRAQSPAHRGEYNIPVMKTIPVGDVMHSDVVTLSSENTVDDAFKLMMEGKFRGLPIVNKDGEVEGIVTMSDVLRVQQGRMKATCLKDIMTRNVIVTTRNESLLDALQKLTTGGIGRLPVVNAETKKIEGILTRSDLFTAYRKYVESAG